MTLLDYSCFFIHTRMQLSDKNRVFYDFRNGGCTCLVSSDLCTRGIDIQIVNLVVYFDLSKISETYLHCICRSGCIGHLGLALNVVTDENQDSLFHIERKLGTEIKAMPSETNNYLYT